MIPIWRGRVENGKLKLDDRPAFDTYIKGLKGPIELIVRRPGSGRSMAQNAYYWGCVINVICGHTGDDPRDCHRFFKQKFLEEYPDGTPTGEFSTAYMESQAFSEYIEKVRDFAARELGVLTPDPGQTTI